MQGQILTKQMFPRQLITHTDGLRGAIKIENRENLGQCPNRGGGVEKKQKCPNFNLGILKTEGGVSIFQKCPNLNYFAFILQFHLYKKCLKFKNVPIWSEGGGQHFSKMSQIQKCPKGRKGGVNPNWDIVPNFLDFLF